MVGQNRVHNCLSRSGPATLCLPIFKFLREIKIDVLCVILNMMCECISATLEQVAKNRLIYICAGLGCTIVAIGFSIGELSSMKEKKLHIGFFDFLGLIAAILQVIFLGLQILLNCLNKSFPIKFSIFSLVFAFVSGFYKLVWNPRQHHRYVMDCKKSTRYLPLKGNKEIHSTKTVLGCPFCAEPKLPHHRLEMDAKYVSIPIISLQSAPTVVGEWIYNIANEYVVPDSASSSDIELTEPLETQEEERESET
ncbi:hypothetical protein Vadar_023659 [Vaccinium darrowii]|uniref:Uncharacterized protein n=1 Tax=Vaccinium darrowii TaxID=229202 RepID=A0ACB7Y986_9ERIC|nr:hypothetical protein Vadar_023659 [Vaccinium darrowii]